MSLGPSDTRELLDRACEFPVERTDVLDAVGAREIESPAGTVVEVGEVLERADEERFESLAALHHTLLANLSDDHIGRKQYDDRSTDPTGGNDVSF